MGFVDQRVQYEDGTVHGNRALAYAFTDNASCPIGGDSGSPGLVGTEAVGFVGGAFIEYSTPPRGTCYITFEQLEYALTSQNVALR